MDSTDIYNEQLKGNTISPGNEQNTRGKGQVAKNTKGRSNTARSNSPRNAPPNNKAAKTNNKKRNKPQHKNPQQNSNNSQLGGNNFNAEVVVDDRDLSWKQYISNISNGNNPSKTANKKFRGKHSSPNGGFDLNHSPMAISAKKVRDIAKNEEWVSEKKEAAKPNVQIRVKGPVKAKSTLDNSNNNNENQKSYADLDAERIDGKLGINK